MSVGGTKVRTRRVGARDVPLRFTLKDGDGSILDISGRNPATDFQVRFVELDDNDAQVSGTEYTGAGAFAFPKVLFNALDDVDAVNDEVDIPKHGFATGDPAIYSNEGGTDIGGLSNGTTYFARRVDDDAISLHPTRQDAIANANKIALTAGLDQEHSLQRDGSNGRIEYSLTAADVVERTLEAELTVTFASALTDVFPTPNRYIVRFKPVI
jgi:hypothetical protein